jgi:hypothetical protein
MITGRVISKLPRFRARFESAKDENSIIKGWRSNIVTWKELVP